MSKESLRNKLKFLFKTDHEWLLDRHEVRKHRASDIQAVGGESEYQKVILFFTGVIQTIGEKVQVRQIVVYTAGVYFRRFYVYNSLKSIDPWLLAPSCLFLAAKVEEYGILSQKTLIPVCNTVVKSRYPSFCMVEYPFRMQDILECEFLLLETLDCSLIVFNPYRSLGDYVRDACETKEMQEQYMSIAWRALNDSLRSDACLLYPPHMIALGCLYLSTIIKKNDPRMITWFAELSVDLAAVLEVAQLLLALYDLWGSMKHEEEVVHILERVPKPDNN